MKSKVIEMYANDIIGKTDFLCKLIAKEVDIRLVRVFDKNKQPMNAYVCNWDDGTYYEEVIYALTTFNGNLAILLYDYDLVDKTNEELLDSDQWMTIREDNVLVTPTLLNIAKQLKYSI